MSPVTVPTSIKESPQIFASGPQTPEPTTDHN